MNRKQFRPIYRFLKFIFPYRKQWVLVLLLGNATAILGLLNPFLAKLAIDNITGRKDLKSLVLIAVVGAVAFLFNSLVNNIKDSLDEYINKRVHFDLNRALFEHMHRLSLSWFRNKTTGEHLYVIDNDVGSVAGFLTGALPQVLWTITQLLFTFAMVFYLNWRMALASLVLAPFIYVPGHYFGKKIEKIREEIVRKSQDVFKMLEENFSHIHLIKAFGRETAAVHKYLNSLTVNMDIDMKSSRWARMGGFVNEFSTKIITGVIGLYGGYQVIKGNMSVGSLTATVAYLYSLIGLQAHLAGFPQSMTGALFSCRRVSEILDEEPAILETKNAKDVSFEGGEIIFDHVSFGYQPENCIIKDLNFRVPGASHIAIAAPSGRGKTTILNLLVRLYDPLDGRVLIDGHDIKDLKFSSLKERIGFVLQEPFLWNDSIENNIRYGRPDASFAQIIEAAQLAGVHEFVKDLGDQFKTVIGENACKISEGQKQKISIARALIRKPKILILDEAMSSMDSASEQRIVSNIKDYCKGSTLITVSHRLSTVMNADLVYYFFGPSRMIVDKAQNLLEYHKDFAHLFIGQDKILV